MRHSTRTQLIIAGIFGATLALFWGLWSAFPWLLHGYTAFWMGPIHHSLAAYYGGPAHWRISLNALSFPGLRGHAWFGGTLSTLLSESYWGGAQFWYGGNTGALLTTIWSVSTAHWGRNSLSSLSALPQVFWGHTALRNQSLGSLLNIYWPNSYWPWSRWS